MSAIVTSIHHVSRIVTQLREINGTWRRAIDLTLPNDQTMTLILYANDDGNQQEQLRVVEQPDEYVQIEDYSPRVERSDKPFSVECSNPSSPNQEQQ